MSQQRKMSGLALLLFSMAAAGCHLDSAQEKVERSFTVSAKTRIRVVTRNGSIKVRGGSPGAVRLRAVKEAKAFKNAKKLLKEIKLNISNEQGLLKIEAEHPSGGFSRNYAVRFQLEVPATCPLELRTRNGSITVRGISGRVAAETRNGSIKAEDLGAPTTLNTRNGSVKLHGKLQQFTVKSRNGSITVKLAGDGKLTGPSSAETRNGSITVHAPASLAAALSATTRNGRIRSDFSLANLSRTRASGTIGKGGAALSLDTRNGSIRIRKR